MENGRWVVAVYDEEHARYIAPMTDQEKNDTGRAAFYASELDDLGCSSYESFESAIENAEILFADVNRQIEEWGI